MKKLFIVGLIGLTLFEVANVYFVMPLPGSQRMRSIDLAYLIYTVRWWARATFIAMIVVGAPSVWRLPKWGRWLGAGSLLPVISVSYGANFRMAADRIFRQPTQLVMEPASRSNLARDRLVVGISVNDDARAYPLQFIGYHHQVRDTVGGQEVLVSYCTVCRTGRVFSPLVGGQSETFRLVGMDHYNAMLEDRTTRSWWRQANGEAVTGPLKGASLAEIPSLQVTLAQWLAFHPASLVMRGDSTFAEEYAKDYSFERGTSRKELTGTDTLSWQDKSWVVGVTLNGRSKAYDWNRLKRERVVHDAVGGVPIILVLADDTASFFVFQRADTAARYVLRGDSIVTAGQAFGLNGRGPSGALVPVQASQEFWHSWRTFQPNTERY